MKVVHRNALPFCWEQQGDAVCLLVHGFTGSPSDLRTLGSYLKDKAIGVSGILLPGHGTTPEDLSRISWPDWYRAVEEEYLRLREKYDRIILVGLSMGGLLSLLLARQHPVSGVVALSVPVYLGNRMAYLAPLLKFFKAYHDEEEPDDQREKEIAAGRFHYHRIPLASLNSFLRLIRTVKNELPGVTAPALIMQSRRDRTVNPKSAQYIYDRLGSRDKKLIWLEKSGHVITLGPERDQVFAVIEEFIRGACN